MNVNGVSDFGIHQDRTVFLVELSNLPEQIQEAAKQLDGPNYDESRYRLYADRNTKNGEFSILPGANRVTGTAGNVYYEDNDEESHWFQVKLDEDVKQQVFDACRRVTACLDTPHGYSIFKTVQFESGQGFVLGEKAGGDHPYSLWMFQDGQSGSREYIWGRFYQDENAAERNFYKLVEECEKRSVGRPPQKLTGVFWKAGKRPSIKEQIAAKPEQSGRSGAHTRQHDHDVR